MKYLITSVLLAFLITLPAPAHAEGSLAAKLWSAKDLSGANGDLERRPGRDLRPPEPSAPREALAPRPATEDGVVRRVKLTPQQKLVALTFDACELATGSTGYDYRIVDFLRREKIPATFFMGGKWMRSHMERTLQLMADPLFELANHAWSHGNFAVMDEKTAREQALWTQAQYENVRAALATRIAAAGMPPTFIDGVPKSMRLLRLPYGRSSPTSLRLLGSLGFTVIQWDVVAELHGNNSDKKLAEAAASGVRPGSIILFHVNAVPKNSHELLENMVALLRAKGYNFVTVGRLLSLGEPEIAKDGYFNKPGDNAIYDRKFGRDGTGIK